MDREVKPFVDVVIFGHDVDHLVIELAWIRGEETKARNAKFRNLFK